MMEHKPFQSGNSSIDNPCLRTPQRETYAKPAEFARDTNNQEREVGIMLPVGCGKSGCITLAPFAFRSTQTLVVAPSVEFAHQLQADFGPSHQSMFYITCGVFNGPPYPEPVGIRGQTTNWANLVEVDVVITNIQHASYDARAPPTACYDRGVRGSILSTDNSNNLGNRWTFRFCSGPDGVPWIIACTCAHTRALYRMHNAGRAFQDI